MSSREVEGVSRFEWERIVRRCLLGPDDVGHLLPEATRRRKTTGTVVKAVALALATYANRDGSRVFPGTNKLAMVLDSSERSVGQALAVLRFVGLIEVVSDGRGRGDHATEYRLTVPVDLVDTVPMLTPNETRRADESSASRPDASSDSTPGIGAEDRTTRQGKPDEPSPKTGRAATENRTTRPPTSTGPSTTSPSPSENEAASSVTLARARTREAVRASRTGALS